MSYTDIPGCFCVEGDRRKVLAEKVRVNKDLVKAEFSLGSCGNSRNGDHCEHSHEIIEEAKSLDLRSARQAGLNQEVFLLLESEDLDSTLKVGFPGFTRPPNSLAC